MSGHGHHDADAGQHGRHDDQHETTSDDYPADEPRSPGWLPLLGGALLLMGIFALVVFSSDPEADADAAKAPPAAAPSAVAPTARPNGLPAQRPASAVRPGAAVPMPPGRPVHPPAP